MTDQPDDLERRYEDVMAFVDVEQRSRLNSKMPDVYHRLYISLVELYPDLLDGEPCNMQQSKVRENAGWPSRISATRFFQDMATIGAFIYEPNHKRTDENAWCGWIIPDPEIFPFPEKFDLRSTERRRRARENEQQRRRNMVIRRCDLCGSEDMVYGLHPRCNSCGHKYAVQEVPASSVAILSTDDELTELFEGEKQYD